MAKRFDPLDLLEEATTEARDLLVEQQRYQRDEVVNRPLVGEERTAEEQRAHRRGFLNDQLLIGAKFDELSTRFPLSDEKPIPRRLVRYLLRAARELKKEEVG